ncbi:MAG: undecaprenyl-diphosphate phosphatase [Truepera sp.]|nr:undecaprenyl-diphosphate phosphatase [Truepera sp.]
MDLLQATVLGIVQGLTEFLPVSSSGHLVLANYYLGWGETLPAYVTFATNTGTLLAVIIALRHDVWQALSGFVRGLVSAEARRTEGWALALVVMIASVPTVLIGLLLRPYFEIFNSVVPVSLALIVTGLILWFTPKTGPKGDARKLTVADALVAGLAQGLAIFPGISRSGTTIAALLWRGSSTSLAPRVSFLMYLVASVGVAVLTIPEVRGGELELAPFIAMLLSSFVVGYLSILWLFSVLRRGKFRWFAPYLWGVAALTLAHVVLS